MIKLKNLLLEETITANTPEFKRWFGNSKVVDKTGNPLVVWKGMPLNDNNGKIIKIIQRPTEHPAFYKNDPGVKIAGFFTDDPEVAKKFAMYHPSQIISTYLKIENPFIIDIQNDFSGHAQFGERGQPFRDAIRSGQYDGVFILNTKDEGNVFVPLRANQIKSTTNVSFDPNDPDITKETIKEVVDKYREWCSLWLDKGLTEGVRLDYIDRQIQALEMEWERLDSQGTGFDRQQQIRVEIEKLQKEKARWTALYSAINEVDLSGDPPVILGALWKTSSEDEEETVTAIKGNNDLSRHPDSWERAVFKWRYIPEIEYLVFSETPSPKEKALVKQFLGTDGYKVKYVSVQAMRGIEKENKLLMNEARATPKMLESFLREMIKGSEWEGKVFLVGGSGRDELMGKEPKDADVVVWKNQAAYYLLLLAKKLGIYNEKTNPVIFPTFGTANLRLDGVVWNGIDFSGETVDAVMFRAEQYHDPNSRKPTVQYTDDIRVDASRRDLTFNALYKDISSGKVLDPTGKGFEDLKNKVIRTPIDPTVIYTDDALRMFRAVRFAVKLGFEPSPEVIEGIKKNLHRLGNTSKERIRDELNKILVSNDPDRGMRLLRDTGLLPYVGKELQQAVGMTQNVHHTQDVFDHTLTVLKGTQPELVRRLMALFHDIGKVVTRSETPTGVHFYGHEDAGPDIAERIMRDLKYPNELIAAVKMGIKNHMRLKQGKDEALLSDKTLRKFKIELGDMLEQVLDVIHADNTSHSDASNMPNQIAKVRARLNALDIKVQKPNLPITGNDLLSIGVKQGPMIGKILGAITDVWYDNPNVTREQALAIAQSMI